LKFTLAQINVDMRQAADHNTNNRMNTSQTNDLIVTYTDGTHEHFKFPAQAPSKLR
jgi:hypothetical protein